MNYKDDHGHDCVDGDDIFADKGHSELAILGREAEMTCQKYRNIGYKKGVFESRQNHVQSGFDAGFRMGTVQSFCQQFIKGLDPTDPLQKYLTMDVLVDESPLERSLPELDALYQTICDRIVAYCK